MTFENSESIFILGHRGFKGSLENTIPAFRRALQYAHGVEFDVRLTRDGKIVLLHDGEFKVNDQTYTVDGLTYGELIHLHPLGKLVTTLKQVLELSPSVMNADLKEINALHPLLESLEKRKVLERTVISTDNPTWVKEIARECPDCRIGLSITGFESLVKGPTLKTYSLHVPLDLIKYSGFEGFRALIRLYSRRGRKIWLWNYRMNELGIIPRVIPLADAVISDDPARLKRFIFGRSIGSGAIFNVGDG